ncbi:kinase-like protein [Rhizophagus irregularis]|uniref:Kinase-like protein n=3 Tax=Rhizophagus irregularis TaxID=588596 RepID=A0A2I1EVT7_9GLOM|nr:Bck1p [Rhizophagus irregularis DAOM 197198w]PKC66565.1 kinase-like protein [Rhizophagus irregularis]PKY26238.1 kinase-like protein [Rhizophagus irregularis]UZO08825.1 hypothetical protein OCT59_029072 [Rhizophagus irregularis]GBC34424.2 kinase-like domain-containing protein [Rhizophagus irregularis DAOM 181602=DAOM 197198]
MIIGYGFDISNDENDDTRLEVHYQDYQDYQNLNDQELTQFIFDQNTFLGIPVLDELNDLDKSFLIGHYFLNKESTIEANVFSYSLKENKYVKLPRSFRFQVLVSGNSKTYESIHFRKKMNGNSIINLIDCGYKYDDLLFISLLSNKNFGPVFFFLKQQPKQIKLKFIDKKISSDECDLRCIVFNPFRSGIFAKLQKLVAPVIRKPEISKITTSEEKKANRDVWIKNKIKDEDINFFEYNEFSNIKTIGEGGFGVVSSAVTDDGNKVALKSFINNNEISEFFEELRLVRKINFHKNLNRFLGITKDHVGNYILVLEYANGGNLREYLSNKERFGSLRWKDKIQMALDITCGLKCLHSKEIIHRDLHSKNILVNDGKLLIADFGLSKKLNDVTSNSIANNMGMIEYIEPQCFEIDNYKKDKRSDIYSLGVLLWEITSGQPPFLNSNIYPLTSRISKNIREQPIEDTPPEYQKLYQECWNGDPELRPNIVQVYEILNQLISKFNDDVVVEIPSINDKPNTSDIYNLDDMINSI